MSAKLLLVFAITELLLSLTPGPAVLLIISQGMSVGFRSSLTGILGILAGNVVYFSLSALGLGALLQASATLFQIIRWLGIAYLILLGARMLLRRRTEKESVSRRAESKGSLQLFSQGVATQLSNPKAIVFSPLYCRNLFRPIHGLVVCFCSFWFLELFHWS
jgi:homoserine/homoserine lactone efflux protein